MQLLTHSAIIAQAMDAQPMVIRKFTMQKIEQLIEITTLLIILAQLIKWAVVV